jgi:hypothetical protein
LLGERKGGLVEDNVTRDDDSIGGRIKASVSLMVSRVAKEMQRAERGASLWGAVAERLG